MRRIDWMYWAIAMLASIVLIWALIVITGGSQPGPVQISASWRHGEIPKGVPVIGLWQHYGELVVIPIVQTDYAGLYEYTLLPDRMIRQLPDPDWWIPLPGVTP